MGRKCRAQALVAGLFLVLLLGIAVLAAAPHGQEPASAAPPASAQPDDDPGILTPPSPREPRINGPSVYGVRPGRPFLYRIPATGDRPMRFSVQDLPAGLTLDAATGIIRGSIIDTTPRGYQTTHRRHQRPGPRRTRLPHRRRRHAGAHAADGLERLVHVLRETQRRPDAQGGRHHGPVGHGRPRLRVREHRRFLDGEAGLVRSRRAGPGARRARHDQRERPLSRT